MRHAEQRSRFLRSEGPEWPTGHTCDAKFEFRRDEMSPMSTLCDGVVQNQAPKPHTGGLESPRSPKALKKIAKMDENFL